VKVGTGKGGDTDCTTGHRGLDEETQSAAKNTKSTQAVCKKKCTKERKFTTRDKEC
jgi:hypothetical protein